MNSPYNKRGSLDARIVRSEVLSAADFIALKTRSPGEIKSCKPVGPELGKKGFGGIEVIYQTPRYHVS